MKNISSACNLFIVNLVPNIESLKRLPRSIDVRRKVLPRHHFMIWVSSKKNCYERINIVDNSVVVLDGNSKNGDKDS